MGSFADLFNNPDAFRFLLNQFAPQQRYQMQEPTSTFTAPQQVPIPGGVTDADRQRLQDMITSTRANDFSRIFMGSPPSGQMAQVLGGFQDLIEKHLAAQQQAREFNAAQENQFGRSAFANQLALAREQMKQTAVGSREDDRLAAQAEQARLAREQQARLAEENIRASSERQRLDLTSREKIAGMQAASKAKTAAEKPPSEASVKEATTIASLADSLDSAEKAFNATVAAHPSRLGQLGAGAVTEFFPKVLGHNIGQGMASSMAPEAQFAEGQLNALSAVIDKLRTGNSRFAIQLYNALRPLVPTVGLTKENAAKKFAMLRQNLSAVLSQRLKLAPNQKPGLGDILRAVQEDMRQVPPVAGQRIPSPQPPTPEERARKRTLDDLADEAMH